MRKEKRQIKDKDKGGSEEMPEQDAKDVYKIKKRRTMIMPRGDRTGPMGMGPMTGRGAGFCAGNTAPGYMNPGYGGGFWGRGRGGGRGGGWGGRNQFYGTGSPGWQTAYPSAYGAPYAYPPYVPNMPKEQEVEALKGQADYFGNALEDVKKRIEELESKAE